MKEKKNQPPKKKKKTKTTREPFTPRRRPGLRKRKKRKTHQEMTGEKLASGKTSNTGAKAQGATKKIGGLKGKEREGESKRRQCRTRTRRNSTGRPISWGTKKKGKSKAHVWT